MIDRKLVYVEPSNLHEYWPLVKIGIEKVREHSADTWLPEDVYAAIKGGNSSLFIGLDGGYEGFIVLSSIPSFDGPVCFIWALYGTGLTEDLLGKYWGEVKQIARDMGARRIEFTSPRPAWARSGIRLGFKPVEVKYRTEV